VLNQPPETNLRNAGAYLDFLGWVCVAVSRDGLRSLSFTPDPREINPGRDSSVNAPDDPLIDLALQALDQLREYLSGARRCFDLPIDWTHMRPFQQQVLRFTAAIPFGEVCTYGQVAKSLGQPGGSRAVGAALGANPIPIVIPCHRVIGADRRLHGFSAPGGIKTKAWLLELEGHNLSNHRSVVGKQGQYEFRF
jgi:methylated-DNA-[protein]-cysteine S-methyltransferase